MATNVGLPKGFVLDDPNKPAISTGLPSGFVLDSSDQQQQQGGTQGVVPSSPGIAGGIQSYPLSPEDEKQAWIAEQFRTGNIEATPKSFWGKVYSELPQIAGEEVGAASLAYAGARAGARLPAGHPLLKAGLVVGGAIAGAGVGAMGGKGFEQTYRMTRPGAKSMSLNDIYAEQLWSGAEGAVSEALGRTAVGVGAKVINKLRAPVKKALIPGVEKLDEILQRAGRTLPPEEVAKLAKHTQELLEGTGSFLTAAQKTQSYPVDYVENAVEKSIFGGNRLFQLKRFLQPATYKHAVKQISDRFWKEAGERMSPGEAGQLFVETVTGQRTAQKSLERIAYKQVDELTSTAVIDLRSTKKLAKELFNKAGSSKGLGQQKAIRILANKVKGWADTSSGFMQGHGMISDLGDEVRRLEGIGGGTKLPKVNRIAKMLDAEATKAMRNAAKRQGPRALTALDAAQTMVRSGKEVLNNETINSAMKLARTKPELVIGRVFTKHGTGTLKAVKAAIDTKTYDTLLASHLDDVITRHSGLAYETRMVPSGTRILDYMDKNLGDDMMQEMFKSPEHLQDFLDVMHLGFTLERKNQAGGGMLIQMLQAGGVADIGTKVLAGEAPKAASWAITMTPALLGRVFANPTGAKWLSTGFKLTGTAQEKWFAKIPPSIVRIMREGTRGESKEKRTKQIKEAKSLPMGF